MAELLGSQLGPAAEGSAEGTGFGVTEQQCDLRQAVVGLHHIALGQGAAHILHQLAELDVLLGQTPLQCTNANLQVAGHLLQAGTATAQAAGNVVGDLAEHVCRRRPALPLLFKEGLEGLEQARAVSRRNKEQGVALAGRQLTQAAGSAAAPMERELDDRLSRAERLMLIELLRKVAGR